ncbi:MAG: hypothetical protein ABR974_12555 [Bacteroidales bacterium]|jgi:hypothetical protein
MNSKSYTNSSGRKVLEYVTPNTIVLDLPFILTGSKNLTRNMPYMLLEGKPKAIRLLDFCDTDGIVYLDVQELLSGSTYTMSWNMEFDSGYWIWSMADFETLTDW